MEERSVAYLNCPECFYRVRTEMARDLEGEASCPRCARLGRLVAMYSTPLSLRPDADVKTAGEVASRLDDTTAGGSVAPT
jgi:hypothetical protein